MSNVSQIYGTLRNSEPYIILNSTETEVSGNLAVLQNLDVCGNITFNNTDLSTALSNLVVDLTGRQDASFNNVDITGILDAGTNGTIKAANFNVGSKNVIDGSAGVSCRALEVKNQSNYICLLAQDTQVTISGSLMLNNTDVSGKFTQLDASLFDVSGKLTQIDASLVNISGKLTQIDASLVNTSNSGGGANIEYNVTVANSSYYINNVLKPILTLELGNSYKFKQDDTSNSGHHLKFYTTNDKSNEYTTNVTIVGTPGTSGFYREIKITSETPKSLYYHCSIGGHNNMGEKMNIINSSTDTIELLGSYFNNILSIDANKQIYGTLKLDATSNFNITSLDIGNLIENSEIIVELNSNIYDISIDIIQITSNNYYYSNINNTINANGGDNIIINIKKIKNNTFLNITKYLKPLTRFTSVPLTTISKGVQYSYTATFNNIATIDVNSSTIPSWLSLVGNVLSGTPGSSDLGVHNVTLIVNDRGTLVTKSFTINVTNIPPTFTSDPSNSVYEDTLYSYTPTVQDNDSGDTLTISVVTKPAWLSWNDSTLSGTPTNDNIGTFSVTLKVTDNIDETNQIFDINVINVNDSPIITSSGITSVDQDSAYSYRLIATDVDVDAVLTYSATIIPSQTWLTLNNNLLSGTPGSGDVGTYDISLTVSDGIASAEQSFTITVNSTVNPPTMEWVWPAEDSKVTDSKDYHPRIGGGQQAVGGWDGAHPIAFAGDSDGTSFPFHSYNSYGVGTVTVNPDDYVDFIFTFQSENTWCSGYRQFGKIDAGDGINSFTKDIEIYTSDANFGPWTLVTSDQHSQWHNNNNPTFTDSGTTTEWAPTGPSKYLLVRTKTNWGDTGYGGRITVRFLQLKLGPTFSYITTNLSFGPDFAFEELTQSNRGYSLGTTSSAGMAASSPGMNDEAFTILYWLKAYSTLPTGHTIFDNYFNYRYSVILGCNFGSYAAFNTLYFTSATNAQLELGYWSGGTAVAPIIPYPEADTWMCIAIRVSGTSVTFKYAYPNSNSFTDTIVNINFNTGTSGSQVLGSWDGAEADSDFIAPNRANASFTRSCKYLIIQKTALSDTEINEYLIETKGNFTP